MHTLRAQGSVLGAFATIAIDNPMMAATGHRICNDCMKACIYQKQEPVDIPQAETSVLKDVLALPWGFEIYALLTRWNPLDIRRPLPRPDSGRKVLIVGLGPAGFTLAHHLMNDGHTHRRDRRAEDRAAERFDADAPPVRDVENAVREPRRPGDGRLRRRRRVRHHRALEQELPETGAPAAGAARRSSRISAACASAAAPPCRSTTPGRWASTTSRCAWAPASRPCSTSRTGWRAACGRPRDFLMALQLTGAAKISSIANLQIRMPVVVIGGGLTAIDTATESLAYYVRQVEKFAIRYRTLVAERGEAAVRAALDAGRSRRSPTSSWRHAAAIRAEREAAARDRRAPPDSRAAGQLGRRHHRLSPPAGGQPVLHAEPRGSGQGDGGRRPLRRGPDADRGRGRRLRPRQRRCG